MANKSQKHLFESFSIPDSVYVGRTHEIQLLESCLVHDKKHLAVINGNNATGKTVLWRLFWERNKDQFNGLIEIISPRAFSSFELPDIQNDTRLVIIEDISYHYNEVVKQKLEAFLQRYPTKQFILVGADKILTDIPSDLRIQLEGLSMRESRNLIDLLGTKELSSEDLAAIQKVSNGNPYLIKTLFEYLNNKHYKLETIIDLITSPLRSKGIIDLKGNAILGDSSYFKQVKGDIRVVNTSILERIKRNPDDIYQLTPRQFEEFTAELLSRRGYIVDLTKATRDGGKDIIVASHADIGNFLYYVECKQYSPLHPVGVSLVRELAGVISGDKVTAGIMVTSSYFSPDAIDFSEKIPHQLSLVDYVKLKEWLKKIL